MSFGGPQWPGGPGGYNWNLPYMGGSTSSTHNLTEDEQSRVWTARASLANEYGHLPSEQDIALNTGVPEQQIRALLDSQPQPGYGAPPTMWQQPQPYASAYSDAPQQPDDPYDSAYTPQDYSRSDYSSLTGALVPAPTLPQATHHPSTSYTQAPPSGSSYVPQQSLYPHGGDMLFNSSIDRDSPNPDEFEAMNRRHAMASSSSDAFDSAGIGGSFPSFSSPEGMDVDAEDDLFGGSVTPESTVPPAQSSSWALPGSTAPVELPGSQRQAAAGSSSSGGDAPLAEDSMDEELFGGRVTPEPTVPPAQSSSRALPGSSAPVELPGSQAASAARAGKRRERIRAPYSSSSRGQAAARPPMAGSSSSGGDVPLFVVGQNYKHGDRARSEEFGTNYEFHDALGRNAATGVNPKTNRQRVLLTDPDKTDPDPKATRFDLPGGDKMDQNAMNNMKRLLKNHGLQLREGSKVLNKRERYLSDKKRRFPTIERMSNSEAGQLAAQATSREKNADGKSTNAVARGKATSREKNADGKSTNAVARGKATSREKNADGKSINAVARGKAANRKKNADGKSINAVARGKATSREKNADGKSINAVARGKESARIRFFGRDAEDDSTSAPPENFNFLPPDRFAWASSASSSSRQPVIDLTQNDAPHPAHAESANTPPTQASASSSARQPVIDLTQDDAPHPAHAESASTPPTQASASSSAQQHANPTQHAPDPEPAESPSMPDILGI